MLADRRGFVVMASTAVLAAAGVWRAPSPETPMYGLIGKMLAVPGQRDALIAVLLEGIGGMPGCLSYIVATDPADENAIWITEVWDSEASHRASLSLPSVKAAIGKGRPLIASFAQSTVTTPIGGHGLQRS